jgi:flagellar FliL protein
MAAADEEAELEPAPPPPAPPMSLLTFLLVAGALTLLALGAGYFGGLQVLSSAERALSSKKDAAADQVTGLPSVKPGNVKALAPIVTNLAGSPPVWIRLEASLVFQGDVPKNADALGARIGEDILAFLRTVSVKQIEGAIGFQHLSEDLNDRVRVRGGGEVQELVIQGLIIE